MAFVVVLDACVLVPHPLVDTLLRAADAGLDEPRWSADILVEVERTLHPDDFLLDLLDLDRPALLQVLDDQARAYVNPPAPVADLCRHLALTVPRSAAEAGQQSGQER